MSFLDQNIIELLGSLRRLNVCFGRDRASCYGVDTTRIQVGGQDKKWLALRRTGWSQMGIDSHVKFGCFYFNLFLKLM